MASAPQTVEQYIASLPAERQTAIREIRKTILKNLPKGVEEGIQYGMIGYFVPHKIYPDGYHCDPKQPLPFASLASQKSSISLYAFMIYGDSESEAWLKAEFKAAGKKLDMGKSCIRFKSLDDVPLNVIGKLFSRMTVKQYIEKYEASRPASAKKKSK